MKADRDSFVPASLSTCRITSLESVIEVFSFILLVYYHRQNPASNPRILRLCNGPAIDYCPAALLHFAALIAFYSEEFLAMKPIRTLTLAAFCFLLFALA